MARVPFYLVDIDGTVADLTHRLRLIQGDKPDWDGFFDLCWNDKPIWEVIETVKLLKEAGADIIMLTGRSEVIRLKTMDWLHQYGIPFDALYMRSRGDRREDYIVKGELLDEVLKEYGMRGIIGAFEDRKQVVDMYRKRGLRVFQVAEGDF